jgi:hypothetical protein
MKINESNCAFWSVFFLFFSSRVRNDRRARREPIKKTTTLGSLFELRGNKRNEQKKLATAEMKGVKQWTTNKMHFEKCLNVFRNVVSKRFPPQPSQTFFLLWVDGGAQAPESTHHTHTHTRQNTHTHTHTCAHTSLELTMLRWKPKEIFCARKIWRISQKKHKRHTYSPGTSEVLRRIRQGPGPARVRARCLSTQIKMLEGEGGHCEN